MKKFTAIFLFVVMLITSIQPIIAMHYCGDELNSFQLYQTNAIEDFCCDDLEHREAAISDSSCCETEVMKLTTDEYQTKSIQPELRIYPLSIDVLGYAVINQLNTDEPVSNTFLTTLKFPTKGLYLDDVSILTYICIYRI